MSQFFIENWKDKVGWFFYFKLLLLSLKLLLLSLKLLLSSLKLLLSSLKLVFNHLRDHFLEILVLAAENYREEQ